MRVYRYLLQSGERIFDFFLNFVSIYFGYYAVHLWSSREWGVDSTALIFEMVLVCLAAVFLYSYHNVYEPMRTKRIYYFLGRILLVNAILAAVLSVVAFWLRHDSDFWLVRWILLSATVSAVVLMTKKITMMTILHGLRSNRKNIKYILVVTDSQEMVDGYLEEIHRNPQYGYSVIGYIGNLNVVGLPHLGTTADLDHVIKEFRPDEVIMAFDTVRKKVISKYISICDDNCVKVMFVPSVCGYFKAPRQISQVGNLPMIDIRSNPLDNISNQMMKRAMDIVVSLILIIVTSPIMLFTAIGVKLSSPGPILFKQRRVGKDNREFTMYKFRSMKVNTDQQTGWSNENDDRKTRFGAFIRKFALDELPQFYNVLIGDMSLVGPRPEVPFYVEKFRREIPLYMLKHTLRPGITGLAQIKGLRGDTSIQARIEEDINYIENWTFWGDIRILLLTPFHAINRHEKYVAREAQDAKRLQALEKRTYVRNYAGQTAAENAEEPAQTAPSAKPTELQNGEKPKAETVAAKSASPSDTPVSECKAASVQTAPAKEPKTGSDAVPTETAPREEPLVERSKVNSDEKQEVGEAPADGDDFGEKVVRTPNAEELIPAEETPAEESVTDLFVTAAADAAPIATEGFQPKDPVNSLGEKTSVPEESDHANP